jgi:hypothetical protein
MPLSMKRSRAAMPVLLLLLALACVGEAPQRAVARGAREPLLRPARDDTGRTPGARGGELLCSGCERVMPRILIDSLGTFVKVSFPVFQDSVEVSRVWMWVRVADTTARTGVLATSDAEIPYARAGDTVTFQEDETGLLRWRTARVNE